MQRLGYERKAFAVPTRMGIKPRQVMMCVGTVSAGIKKFLDNNIHKALLFHITRNPKKRFWDWFIRQLNNIKVHLL